MKRALIGAASAVLLFAGPAAAAPTTNYGWAKPTIGSDDNAWGEVLNQTTDDIDADLKAVQDIANGVDAAANPAIWQKVAAGSIGSSSGTLTIPLGDCKAYKVILQGIGSTSDGVSFTARFAFNNSYDSGPNYASAGSYQKTDGSSGVWGLTNQTALAVAPVNIGDDVNLNQSIEATVLLNGQNPVMLWEGWLVDGSANFVAVRGAGRMIGIAPPSHLGFFLGAGTFRSGGTWGLYCNPHL